MNVVSAPIFFSVLVVRIISCQQLQPLGRLQNENSDTADAALHHDSWNMLHMYDFKREGVPSPELHSRTATYVRYQPTTPSQKRDALKRILLFGGGIYSQSSSSDDFLKGTWVYTPNDNSWFLLPLQVQPTIRTGHSLTTVREDRIILFGGYDGENHLNDLWLFDGENEHWKKLSYSGSAMRPAPRAFHSAVSFGFTWQAVLQGSLVVYGGASSFQSLLSDLWELSIVGRRNEGIIFRWVELNRCSKDKSLTWPPPLFAHSAVILDNTTMILGGGILEGNSGAMPSYSFWIYNKTSERWLDTGRTNFTFFAYRQIIPGYTMVNMSPYFLLVFHPGMQTSLFIEFGKVYAFNATLKHTWAEKKTIVDGAAPDSKDFGFSAVVVDRKVLVFGGRDILTQRHTASLKVRELEQVAGDMWKWQLRSQDSTNNNYVTSFSWALLSNKIIRSASVTSHTGFVLDTTWLEAFMYLLFASTKDTLTEMSLLKKITPNDFSFLISSVSFVDLVTQTWWQYDTSSANIPFYYTTSTGFKDEALVTYGGLTTAELKDFHATDKVLAVSTSQICVYSVAARRWFSTVSQSDRHSTPEGRLFPTMIDIGNNSLILFGGVTVNGTSSTLPLHRNRFRVTNDMWMLTIGVGWEDNSYTDIAVVWQEMVPREKQKSSDPIGRFGHTAIFVNGQVVIWGGMTTVLQNRGVRCLRDLWYFNLESKSWSKAHPIESTMSFLDPGQLCRAPITVLGNRIVTINYSMAIDVTKQLFHTSLMSALPNTKTWIEFPSMLHFLPRHLFGWRGQIVAVDHEILYIYTNVTGSILFLQTTKEDAWISVIKPQCMAGYVSEEWSMSRCMPCPKGQFAAPGAASCAHCPGDLTTNTTASSSLAECSCSHDYCLHGDCSVVQRNRHVGAKCICHFGFTGAKCQYPTYFVIAGASAIGLVVIILLLVFMYQMIKFRNLKKLKDGELEQLGRVWNICSSELQLRVRLDVESPGSYGEVYKARYRDMTVAVKRLKDAMISGPTERDFAREILLMKSMRHPNLVLFFGAGRFTDDNCPFLVVELMQNGSLSNLLQNSSVSIAKPRQLQFCLDAIKGIDFLHNQRPSRIHRDIKSSNLLLSEEWVVKVADFGSARLVKGQGVTQRVEHRRRRLTSIEMVSIPLLTADSYLSDDVGTLLWRAPEVFAGETYSTAVDIYSFGIVMWEIVARKAPFHDRKFRWIQDISNAVQSGIRPTMPNDVSDVYRNILNDCWATNPVMRPTSSEVSERLKELISNNES